MAAQLRSTFWTGSTGRLLSALPPGEAVAGKLLGIYLVSGPMAELYGLYRLDLGLAAWHTSLDLATVERALTRLSELGYARYEDGWVWVIEMAAYQLQAPLKPTDLRVKHIVRWYEALPPNPFLGAFFDRYARDLCLDGRTPRRAAVCGAGLAPPPRPAPPSPSVQAAPVELAPELAPAPRPEAPALFPEIPAPATKKARRAAVDLSELHAWFEAEFWPTYPRHTHKKAALQALEKLRPDVELRRRMVEALERQRRTVWAGVEIVRIPHPGTWINGRRWEDEIPDEPMPAPAVTRGPQRPRRQVLHDAAIAEFLEKPPR